MDSHICAFLAGCATVAYVWHSFSQHLPRDENGPDASSTLPSTDKEQAVLLREQLTRNFQFFGDHGMLQIQNAFIVVVGLGGVGSHAAVHLLRSGVGRLRLVDFDQVTLSSLNRHAVAELADVGTPKVVAVQRFARRVVPLCPVEACVEMFSAADADRLLADTPDFVLDCIDNIDTKVDLLRLCHERGIKVISSMGSACKADPSRIHLADLSETQEDRLAKAVRSRLKAFGIFSGIPVVYSTERSKVSILPFEAPEEGTADDYAPLPGFRVRTLPVLGALPAMFGSAMASYVLCTLADFQLDPLARKSRPQQAQRLYSELCTQERKAGRQPRVTLCDIVFLLDDVWKNKSSLNGSTDRLFLSPWDKRYPSRLDNLVLLTKQELATHDSIAVDDLEKVYGPAVCANIMAKLRDAGKGQYTLPLEQSKMDK